jgi:hypothetical protein
MTTEQWDSAAARAEAAVQRKEELARRKAEEAQRAADAAAALHEMAEAIRAAGVGVESGRSSFVGYSPAQALQEQARREQVCPGFGECEGRCVREHQAAADSCYSIYTSASYQCADDAKWRAVECESQCDSRYPDAKKVGCR